MKTALKDALRNRMSPELLDALMRIKLHEDTIETFDVNKATSKYLEHHFRCDRAVREPPLSPTSSSTCPSVRSEAQTVAAEEDSDHTYARPAMTDLTAIQKKPNSECIAIISKASGKALTVFDGEVQLFSFKGEENQLWYRADDFIVSNFDGNVLERTNFAGESVKLSQPNYRNDRQKWKMVGTLLNLETSIVSLEENFYLSALGTVTEDGAKVGASKKAKVNTQGWGIERMSDYFATDSGATPMPFDTTRAPTRDQIVIEKQPDDELINIKNIEADSSLTALSDNRIFVMKVLPDEEKSVWFKRRNHIVSYNGKVLQVDDPGKPVHLAFYDQDESKQKWNFQTSNGGNLEIISFYQGLKLDLIRDEWNSELVLVGGLAPNEEEDHNTDVWKTEVRPKTDTLTNGQLIKAKPGQSMFQIQSVMNGRPLTFVGDEVWLRGIDNPEKERWFFEKGRIVSSCGKVLQVSNEDGPVKLALYNANEIKQQWEVRSANDGEEENKVIASAFNDLRLDTDQFVDSLWIDDAQVSANTPEVEDLATQTWWLKPLTSVE